MQKEKLSIADLEALKNVDIPFGGGHLTLKEVNQLLNHLPLEISFINKNDDFKYFNQRMHSDKMIFARTSKDLGTSVYSNHPEKSQDKVVALVEALKTRERDSVSMWYKTKDQYIYITFAGVFDDNGEYLGIMEYLQDIQPFFELPSEVKVRL